MKGILNDADVIIHAAGSVETTDREALREANVELTRRIVSCAPKGCRIVFISSISVYGKRLAKIPADEQTRTSPDSDYSRSKLDAEKFVAAWPDHAILRLGTLYGPGFSDYFRIFSYLEQGRMKIIGDGKNRLPFLHVEDAADAVACSVERGAGVFVIAGEPLAQEEVYSVAAKALGVEPPRHRVGLGLALLIAAGRELASRLGGKKPGLTSEHVSILGNDRAFDCAKARKELGFRPRPLDHGIREMVLAYRKAKSARKD